MNADDVVMENLIRRNFPGKSPLEVDPSQVDALATEIEARLAAFSYLKPTRYAKPPQGRSSIVYGFSLAMSENEYAYSSIHLELALTPQNGLTIKYYRTSANVSNLDELVDFGRDCQEFAERRRLKERKAQKIRDLKAQAILAHVRKLALEERFSFYAQTNTRNLKLFVKLSEETSNHKYVELSLPLDKFEQMVPLIRNAVSQLRQLSQAGIRFRVGERSPFDWRRKDGWITPESLEG